MLAAVLGMALHAAPAEAARGDVDAGYGNEGAAVLEKLESAFDLAVSDSGAAFLIGRDYDYRPGIVMRVRPDGHIDRDYGGNGRAAIPGDAYASSVAVDSRGRALALARPGLLTRLKRNGEIDRSFAGDGTVRLPQHEPYEAFVDSRDRVLVRSYGGRLIRLSRDGELPEADTTDFPESFAAEAMDIDSRDRVVALGYEDGAETNPRVIRLKQSLEPDTGFGSYAPFVVSDPLAISVDNHDGAWMLGGECYRDCYPLRLNHMDEDGTRADDFGKHRVPDGYIVEADRGGVIAGGDNDFGHKPYTGRLTRLRSDGHVDRRWGAYGSAFPISGVKPMDIYGVESTSHGVYVFGTHGYDGNAVVRLSNERGPADADGDGVLDRKDPCPALPDERSPDCFQFPPDR